MACIFQSCWQLPTPGALRTHTIPADADADGPIPPFPWPTPPHLTLQKPRRARWRQRCCRHQAAPVAAQAAAGGCPAAADGGACGVSGQRPAAPDGCPAAPAGAGPHAGARAAWRAMSAAVKARSDRLSRRCRTLLHRPHRRHAFLSLYSSPSAPHSETHSAWSLQALTAPSAVPREDTQGTVTGSSQVRVPAVEVGDQDGAQDARQPARDAAGQKADRHQPVLS